MQSLPHAAVVIALLLALTEIPEVNGAPIINWNICTESSIRLNKLAQHLAREVLGDSGPMYYNISDKVVLVEASDMCDPAGLKTDSKPCLQKITAALSNYSRIFQKKGLFPGSEWETAQVASTVSELLGQLRHEEPQGSTKEEPGLNEENWMQEDLQRYSVERLRSFSILAARVFAAGNPASHGNAPAAHCHQS
ncbi:hypothetical protein AAFF_G00102800 [Aldrovandia affinis]|uniref:Interleukin-23 subunit alpha n=1 Tax=Aldrovandia affinis TaxID=143900 RepID=A0AAD7RUN5_9TELE|nr:hypothetical protein AAFF_G00102800 [Aldrovandia affinis]